MKRISLLFIQIIACITLQAQNVFETDSTIWNVGQFRNGYLWNQIIYGLNGDTIINDTTYRKLYVLNDTLININDDKYYGGIRTEDKKVYFKSIEDFDISIVETLLYDFSKEVGETIEHKSMQILNPYHNKGLLPEVMWFEKAASTVTNKITDESGRIRLNISSSSEFGYYGDEWIEGIGSGSGFFWAYCPNPTNGDVLGFRLLCVKSLNRIVYMDNDKCESLCFCGGTGSYIEENKQIPSFFVISTEGKIIRVEKKTEVSCRLRIFDLLGRTVAEKTLDSNISDLVLSSSEKTVLFYCIEDQGAIIEQGKIMLK